MNKHDSWDDAPNLTEAFNEARSESNEEEKEIVTKAKIEELEAQAEQEKPEPELVPDSMKNNKPRKVIPEWRKEQIERMKEQLNAKKDKAKDDFERSK